jgi:signal transduction histidine kinase
MDALRANRKVITEIRHFKKNGELRWARVYAQPIWDSTANRLDGIVGAVQDITEQKEVKEREIRRQLMLEKVIQVGKHMTEVADLRSTVEKIWHALHDDLEFGRVGIFLYNAERQSMDDTFGTSNEGEMLDYWYLSFPLGDDESVSHTFARVLEKPDALYFTHQYDTDHEVAADMLGVKDFASVAAWAGTKPVAVLCVDNMPTTNRIGSEQLEALRLFAGYAGLAIENAYLNTSLQHELSQRQSFIAELEAKNAELERFTYTVSHDLKSPLVTIVGFLGYVEKDALAGNIERVRSGMDRITNAARKMEDLLNDLLELSRIGRLMNPAENVSFEEIVRDALERVRGRIEAQGIEVVVAQGLPVVYGDRVRLVEIVQNLLDNAAKFSSETARPRIEVGMKGLDENLHPILFVCDNGIGIAPEFHERIFGLFNKLNPQIEGTGIGLTLVKRIVEVHGGRIWVESAPGHGATFYFTLPAQKDEEAGKQLGA